MPTAAKKTIDVADDTQTPDLTIPLDKIGFIIEKAREFDAKEGVSDPDSGSNPTDDGAADILEDQPDDADARQELYDAIRGLNEDQRHRTDRFRPGLAAATYDLG